MRAMLLAAGLGTRLGPLTQRLPKPAVPLMNRPLASFAIEHLARAGVHALAFNAHHLPDAVGAAVRASAPVGVVTVMAHEPTLLGTGGGVAAAFAALEQRIGPMAEDEAAFVMNADVLFAPDLEAALRLHRASGAMATMIVRSDPRAISLGPVEIDAAGRVRRLLGVPRGDAEAPLETTMFTGVHVLSARAIRDLPPSGCIIRKAYRRWIDRGETVCGFVEPSAFRDLGTPRDYLAAHLDLLRGAVSWPRIARSAALVAPGAVVDGAELTDVVIGAGAYVAPGVTLARAVVWPGAVVRASDRDVILFEEERLDAL